MNLTYRTNVKRLCSAQKRSMCAPFATAHSPHSRDMFLNKKTLPVDSPSHRSDQEGILAYKVFNDV